MRERKTRGRREALKGQKKDSKEGKRRELPWLLVEDYEKI